MFARGGASPENLQLIQSRLWVLCQEPAFPVCGAWIRSVPAEDPVGGSFHWNHQESLFILGTVGIPSEGSLPVLMVPSSPGSQEPTHSVTKV